MVYDKITLLLSYPRCGNSFVRYCIETMTQCQSYDCNNLLGTFHHKNPFMIKQDSHIKPFLYKEHFAKDCDRFDKNNNIILLLRNYKECLVRHQGSRKITQNPIHHLKQYTDNILFYEKWKGKKIILYYEDLILDFNNSIYKLTNFINIPQPIVINFIKNYDHHKQKSIESYKRCGHDSVTKGKNLLFHSKNLSKQIKKQLDEYIISNKILYLNRYIQ